MKGALLLSYVEAAEPCADELQLRVVMKRVGRYEILEKLGQGGQSIAFKARDPQIDRLVVIKLVRDTEQLTRDGRTEFSARFHREAQAAGRLSHPNIATIYDISEDQGRPFIAMEYVDGETLNHLVRRDHPLAPDRVVALFVQLCGALQYAHNLEVVHRDIKPENIMVTPSGQVKVVDFGIARLPASTLTQDGHLLGTPSYMSPEQVQGHKIDHRSDIFSLGVVLYEALTGERPFEGDHPTTIIFKIVSDQQRLVREINPNLDSRFDEILSRALAKTPDQRFGSCEEMGRALSELADGQLPASITLPVAVPAASSRSAAGSEPTLVEAATQSTSTSLTTLGRWINPVREQAGLLILGGLVGAALLAFILIWQLSGTSPPATEAVEESPSSVNVAFVGPLPPSDWQPRQETEAIITATPTPPPPAGVGVAKAVKTPEPPSLPPAPAGPARLTESELMAEGLKAFRENRFSAARTYFAELTDRLPNSSEAYYFLGMSAARTAGPGPAVRHLQRAVELRPEDPLFRIQLALHLEENGQDRQAIAHFRKAVELGGHTDFDAASLRDHLRRLQANSELAQLAPYEAPATHDHFIRGCKGLLSVTRTDLKFVSTDDVHKVAATLADLREVKAVNGRLELVLADGAKWNFKIDDPSRVLRIYELTRQLEEADSTSRH